MPVDISGLTGVTTPGLASGTMPTSGGDPIVESGSNSDGEWVRWANGSQTCVALYTNLDLASGAVTVPWPAPFVSQPRCVVSGFNAASRVVTYTAPTATNVSLNCFVGDTGARVGSWISSSATGSWK